MLDDVAAVDQVGALLDDRRDGALLLAGRGALGAVSGPAHLQLGRLSATGSLRLLRDAIGATRVDAEPRASAELVRLCDGLPLALRIVASRLATRPRWTLADFATKLSDPHRRLDLLTRDNRSVRASLQAGVLLLERAGDPSALTALALVGELDLPVLDVATIGAAMGVGEQVAQDAAEALVDAGLAEALTVDTYRFSHLVRLFAQHQGEAVALPRAVEHYAGLVRARLIELDARPDSPGLATSGLAWYRKELGTLRSLALRDHTDTLTKLVDELRWTLAGGRSVAGARTR